MRKAVEVQARVYVEGEAEPTADFAAIGKRVVAEALRLGSRQVRGYTFTIKGLEVSRQQGGLRPGWRTALRPAASIA